MDNRSDMNKQTGFTLIELMIVVVIIAIIAGIAVPNYQNNVRKGSRGEGMTTMIEIMRAQENFYASAFSYTTNLNEINYPDPFTTDSGRYIISASSCGVDPLTECVQLTAIATNGQELDGNLILDSRGNRSRNGVVGWAR